MPQSSGVTLAQLIFFILATGPVIYTLWKHGKHGILAWYPLSAFCLLRVIGDAIIRHDQSRTGYIIAQVALSPLFLTFFGIQHEASISLKPQRPFEFGWPLLVITHLAVFGALALVIAGALKATSSDATNSQQNLGFDLVRVGMIIFIVCWFVICVLVWMSARLRSKLKSEKRLLIALGLCVPLLAVRVLYSTLGAFINSDSWNFINGGTLAEDVTMAVVPEFLLTIILAIGGIMTRMLPQERAKASLLASPPGIPLHRN